MEKSEFDLLLERYVLGNVSADERRKIEAWLDALGSGDDVEGGLTEAEEERIFRKLAGSLVSGDVIPAVQPRRKTSAGRWLTGIAASVIIITAVVYAVRYYAAPDRRQAQTAFSKDLERIILNDGSLIWLRGESSVQYYEANDGGSRHASFQGDALFEVAKDENRPFIVESGDFKVRVLGTSFRFRTAEDRVELTVLTGHVNLSSSMNVSGIDILPKEKVVYQSSGEYEKVVVGQEEIASIARGTYYNMEFTNIAMAEVIDRLERKFNVAIELSDKRILNCRVTMDLTDQSLAKSLQLIADVLDVTYNIGTGTVTIDGAGCQ